MQKNPIVVVGRYAVELRLPVGGIYAGEEIDIEFRVTDRSKEDPVDGAPGVVRATATGKITMPSMASMPPSVPRFHAEGVPGDYGLVTTFPHGGDYRIALTITPPGGSPFLAAFLIAVNDEAPVGKRKPAPKPFSLELTTNPRRVEAGKTTGLALRVRRRLDRKLVTEFDIVHEQKLHLIVVREDLGSFFHEHPTLQPDGTFLIDFTFPTSGRWTVFADVAPRDAGSQVLFAPLTVVGGPVWRKEPLVPQPRPVASDGGHTLTLRPLPLVSGKQLPLTFDLREVGGEPVSDLQPWLGALAHLILVHEDAQTFVHSHPDEADPTNGKKGKLTFLARFPKPGLYRGWAQFQRAGKLSTLTFVVKVVAP